MVGKRDELSLQINQKTEPSLNEEFQKSARNLKKGSIDFEIYDSAKSPAISLSTLRSIFLSSALTFSALLDMILES